MKTSTKPSYTIDKEIDKSIDLPRVRDDLLSNSNLSKRELHAITERFGFNTTPKTLEETAVILGCSRSRIQQLEHYAFRKMRLYIHDNKKEYKLLLYY
jgi:DNA-directed RNA polymerase sigma subunit (sigma70/sigma32)